MGGRSGNLTQGNDVRHFRAVPYWTWIDDEDAQRETASLRCSGYCQYQTTRRRITGPDAAPVRDKMGRCCTCIGGLCWSSKEFNDEHGCHAAECHVACNVNSEGDRYHHADPANYRSGASL